MKENNYTIHELGNKLEEMMENKSRYVLYLHELDEENIFYFLIQEGEEIYFLCKDGLCGKMVYLSNDIKHSSLNHRDGLFKVEENELDRIAKKSHEYKRKIETIQQDIEIIEKLLDSQKIRGLFAKLKASK